MSTRIETAEQFEAWFERASSSVYLVELDHVPGPALVWPTEDGDWYGIRPVHEDDGPWRDLPDHVRASLAVRVDDFGAFDDDEGFVPFTVLWPTVSMPAPGDVQLPARLRARETEPALDVPQERGAS